MQTVHVFISGRVQGVFFRDSTQRQAGELGIHGWVRNVPDGRVEATFQGEPKAVDDMLEWCRHGSSQARVEDVVVEHVDDPQTFQGFVVRPTPRD